MTEGPVYAVRPRASSPRRGRGDTKGLCKSWGRRQVALAPSPQKPAHILPLKRGSLPWPTRTGGIRAKYTRHCL